MNQIYEVHAINMAVLMILFVMSGIVAIEFLKHWRHRRETQRQHAIYQYHSAKCRQALLRLEKAVNESPEDYTRANEEVEQAMREYRIKENARVFDFRVSNCLSQGDSLHLSCHGLLRNSLM